MYFLKHIKLPRRPINNVAQLTNENGENRATTFGKSDPTRSKQQCCKNQFFDKEYYNGSSPAAKKEEKIENTTEVLWRPEGGKLLVSLKDPGRNICQTYNIPKLTFYLHKIAGEFKIC